MRLTLWKGRLPLADSEDVKVRRVFRAVKRRVNYGELRGEPRQDAMKNIALVRTAQIMRMPVRRVKELLAETAQ